MFPNCTYCAKCTEKRSKSFLTYLIKLCFTDDQIKNPKSTFISYFPVRILNIDRAWES